MYGYKVNIGQVCNHRESSEEQYGSWSESNSNYFEYVTKTDKYPDIVSSLDIKAGHPCFVVWAEWSSGDSFGQSINGRTEALAIFETLEAANEFETKLIKPDGGYLTKFSTQDNQQHEVRCPWTGYFEDLTDIHIEQAVLK